MAQVKDLVKSIQSEIKAVIEKREAAGVKDADLDILLRLESKWSSDNLLKMLDEHASDGSAVSQESLKFLLDFLSGRYELIKDTDGIYNHHPKSLANVISVIVAKHLHQALSAQGDARKHYYEYLFPGLRCADYVTSKGDLGALELHEFFLSHAGIPIETLLCLERYREVTFKKRKQITPFHVCLPEGHVLANASLEPDEVNRMNSYSSIADQYYKEITHMPMRSSEELDVVKAKLLAQVAADNFVPKYTYNNPDITDKFKFISNINLLKHEYLARVGVTDMQSFAKLLVTIDPNDWFDFVDAIDDQFLDQVLLPKIEEKQPHGTRLIKIGDQAFMQKPDKTQVKLFLKVDIERPGKQVYVTSEGATVLQYPDKSISLRKPNLSVLDEDKPEKFGELVDSQPYDKDSSSLINRAIPFLILYRYIRKLDDELDGPLDGIVGDKKNVKKPSAMLLLKFIPNMNYLINQPDTYFAKVDSTVSLPPCKRGRVGYVYRKLISLGPTKFESAENLAKFAELLSHVPGEQWEQSINAYSKNFKNIMQKYVDASGGLVKCIKSQNYIENADRYNRALLFLQNEFYILSKMDEDEASIKAGYKKDKKVPAAIFLRGFFSSNHPLNDLKGYASNVEGGVDHLPVIDDIANYISSMFHVTKPSVLNTLVTVAANLHKPEFYKDQEAARQKNLKQVQQEQTRHRYG